jgi:2-polyprenyl-6-methoxyphenol hydroxylase-like FAD-dependent oxidoreductase
MTYKTDVLIVGAGPTGLMMACQLERFGVPFRIIDKQANRSQESRAFGIQAKTMEIFQNLGIASEFLKHAEIAKKICFYVNGKLKFVLNFENIEIAGAPFPHLYLLPQSDTEQILLDYLEKKGRYYRS